MASSVNLGKPAEDDIDDLVTAGHYGSRDDVLREGVRLVKIKERQRAELDAALQAGLADVAAGRVIPAEEVLAYFEAKYAASPKERKA